MKHIPNNEILYTTANGEILSNFDKYAFSSNLISNEYTNNHGVLTFATDLTIIGNSAFALCEELESIIIPDTIVKIDEGAFSCCENLQEITIPKNVTSVGECAFALCINLTKFLGKFASDDGMSLIVNGVLNQFALGSELKEYTIPLEVTEIGWSAFSESQLTKVVLHDKIRKIGHSAFCGCANLSEINIPNSVITIDDAAFQDCTALKDIFIPKSVLNLGINIFEGCSEVSLSNETEIIESSRNSDTAKQKLSEGYVYSGDKNAKIIRIPDGVSLVKSEAFEDCKNVEVIYIPSSVTKIEDGAFSDLNNLYRFESEYASKDGRCLIIRNTLLGFAGKGVCVYTLPYGITNIAPLVFCNNTEIRTIDISVGVRRIGYQAFWMCEKLEKITLPNSLKVIGESAFGGCESLVVITVPNSVKVLEEFVFHDCTQLEEITLPSNLLVPNGPIFSGCKKLKKVNSPLVSKDGDCLIIDGVLVDYIGQKRNSNCVIPNGVITIADSAFYGKNNIISVVIPQSVKKIGGGAFHSCNNLVSAEFTSTTPPKFGSAAFYANASRFSIYIPTGTKKIYKKALKEAKIDAIIFDKSKENADELFHEIIYGNQYDNDITAEKLLSIGVDCSRNDDIEGSIAVFEKLITLKGFKDDYPYHCLIHIYRERVDVENEKRILSLAIENLPERGRQIHEYRVRLGKLSACKRDKQMPTSAKICVPEIKHGELYELELLKLPEFNFYTQEGPIIPWDWNEREKLLQPVVKIIDYFKHLIEEAEIARSKKDYNNEAQIYEQIIAEKYWRTTPYDKLIKLYSRAKLYDEEIRVLKLSIEHFSKLHAKRYEYIMRLADKYNAHDYINKRSSNNHGRIVYSSGWFGDIVLYELFPIIDEWKLRLEKKLNRKKIN